MIKTIKRKFKPVSRPKGGMESVFIPITNKIGLKGYITKKEAVTAMKLQKKVAKHGFGPMIVSEEIFEVVMPVGGTFLSSIKNPNALRNVPKYKNKRRRLYAYKTQIVPKLFNSNCYINRGKYEKKYTELMDFMKRHNFSIDDIHPKNVGILKNKMVFLDFGDLSAVPYKEQKH